MAENQYELEAENVRMRINAVLKEKGLTENSVAVMLRVYRWQTATLLIGW